MDPNIALKACESVVNKTPELIELCRSIPPRESLWDITKGILLHGQLPPWLFPTASLGGAFLIFRNNITTFAQNQAAKNKAAQKAIQENLNRFDLDLLEKVTEFEAPKTRLTPETETPAMMRVAEDFITGVKGQQNSGENRRGSSIAKTVNVDVSGLWVKEADCPAVFKS